MLLYINWWRISLEPEKSSLLTRRFFKIVKEGVHISVHSSSITAKLPVISSEYRLFAKCRGNSRFLLFVEFIDQWICELEVSFLHLWSQSICDLVTEGIGGENKLFANVVVWLNKIILELEKLSRIFRWYNERIWCLWIRKVCFHWAKFLELQFLQRFWQRSKSNKNRNSWFLFWIPSIWVNDFSYTKR